MVALTIGPTRYVAEVTRNMTVNRKWDRRYKHAGRSLSITQ